MHRILVVEDSLEMLQLIRRALGVSVQIEAVQTVQAALELVDKHRFDLVILDIGLPDGDGYRLCSVLRASNDLRLTPVIFLTGRTAITDKILAFSVGCDDYITKPFEPAELKARVEAKLNRWARKFARTQLVRVGDLTINMDRQTVQSYADGSPKTLDLTPTEFKILVLLAKSPMHPVSREAILETVWGENVHVYNRCVDTHVSKLRKKLGLRSDLIRSVHGFGYRLAAEPSDDCALHLTPDFQPGTSAPIPGHANF